MSKIKTVQVKKTDKLNQIKLHRIARKYGIPPISVREIQLGFPEEIPHVAADLLIADGFVVRVKKAKLRSAQERVDTTQPTEPVVTSDDTAIVAVVDEDEDTTDAAEERMEQV